MNQYISNNTVLRWAVILLLSLASVFAKAQTSDYQRYIERYAPLAVEQMNRHKIPASITLAHRTIHTEFFIARIVVLAYVRT